MALAALILSIFVGGFIAYRYIVAYFKNDENTGPNVLLPKEYQINRSVEADPRLIPLTNEEEKTIPISVNCHFTRCCNAEYVFCFYTETDSYILPRVQAKEGLHLLAEEGMKKLNMAGGEPFLYTKFLSEICKHAKVDLKLESVSIVSNGESKTSPIRAIADPCSSCTKITEKWLCDNHNYVNILAVSCDSFDGATNKAIGRADRGSGIPWDMSIICSKSATGAQNMPSSSSSTRSCAR